MAANAIAPEITLAGSVPKLRDSLERFTAATGFKYYTYVAGRVIGGRRVTNFDPRERPFHLTNIPGDWQAEYSHNRYYDHDPTMLFALCNLLPARWTNIIRRSELTAKQHQIINDARDAGLRDGVIVPVHGPGGEFAVLSLTHSESERQAGQNVELDETRLHMFALRFHNEVRQLQETGVPVPAANLTSREIDVLFWTAEGKSTWDISQILCISESTVNFHINSAKQKLGVYSKPHAVAKMFSFRERFVV